MNTTTTTTTDPARLVRIQVEDINASIFIIPVFVDGVMKTRLTGRCASAPKKHRCNLEEYLKKLFGQKCIILIEDNELVVAETEKTIDEALEVIRSVSIITVIRDTKKVEVSDVS